MESQSIKNMCTTFAVIAFFVYLTGLSFDLGVTWTVYKDNPDYFFSYEANEEFVNDVKESGNFFFSDQIVLAYSFILLYMALYLITLKAPTMGLLNVFTIVSSAVTAKGLVHFFAGSTWLTT